MQKGVNHIERIGLESKMTINNRVEYGIVCKIADKNPTVCPTPKRVLKRQGGPNELKTVL